MGNEIAGSRTSPTLLSRLRADPSDEAAWSEFVLRYGPKIVQWCHAWKLQPADINDVTQQVLLKLQQTMRDFHYDKDLSFRGWLKTITHHALYDFVQQGKKVERGSGDSQIRGLLQSLETRDDLVARLGEAFDLEIWEQAKINVQLRVKPRTWEAFVMSALEGAAAKETAEKLGMSLNSVYQAKFKVQKHLEREIQKLRGEEAE